MGCCGGSNSYVIFDKCEGELFKDTKVEGFDGLMAQCEEVIKDVEVMRGQVSGPWGKLLCQSGAVVLQKPGVMSCLMGLLFQAARDLGHGVDKMVTFKKESPFLEITADAKSGPIEDITSTKDCFVDFVCSLEPLAKESAELAKKIEEIFTNIMENITKWMGELKVEGLDEIRKMASQMNGNKDKVEKALLVMKDIVALVANMPIDAATLFNKMKDEKTLAEYYELFKKINSESKTDKDVKSNRMLYWKYTLEEKFGDFEQVKPIWKKITGEEYQEKGPAKVEPKKKEEAKGGKEETKKDDKAGGKKEDAGKKEEEKKETGKKDLANATKVDIGKKEEKDDGGKYALQREVDDLRKIIEELRAKVDGKSNNRDDNKNQAAGGAGANQDVQGLDDA